MGTRMTIRGRTPGGTVALTPRMRNRSGRKTPQNRAGGEEPTVNKAIPSNCSKLCTYIQNDVLNPLDEISGEVGVVRIVTTDKVRVDWVRQTGRHYLLVRAIGQAVAPV